MATRILRHRLGYLNEPNTRSKKIPPVIKIGAELILAYPTKDCVLMFDPPSPGMNDWPASSRGPIVA